MALKPLATHTLSLTMLTALVVGSMIESGIFNLPQNMATHGGGGAILIGWLITCLGMLMLCFVYQALAIRKPELNNGVYAYARAGAGEFMGFNSAWGYWVSACLGNVSALIAAVSALGYFSPQLGEGNTAIAIFFASLVLWLAHGFILKGIKGATVLNSIITLVKIIPLLLFIVITCLAFQLRIFQLNFWGEVTSHSFIEQIKSTMLVTVWVFIGVEGASVYSGRARKRADVGKATLLGFAITFLLLVSVSLLPLGVLPQAELVQLKNLSMAEVLGKIVGEWGVVMIVLSLLLSISGAFLAWLLLAAESLFTPAKDGLLPRGLAQENKRGVPHNALWLTSGFTQIFLLITFFAKTTYLAVISLATSMILIPYLFSAVYAIQVACRNKTELKIHHFLNKDGVVGMLATMYCGWLLYAAGLKYLLLSTLLYVPGAVFYIVAKHQQKKRFFKLFEIAIFWLMFFLAVVSVYLLITHKLTL